MAEELTHKQLVDYAARWLRNKHPVVVTELATIGEEADAIGFYRDFTVSKKLLSDIANEWCKDGILTREHNKKLYRRLMNSVAQLLA